MTAFSGYTYLPSIEETMNYSKKFVKTHKNESTYETSEGIKLSCSKSCRKCQIKLRLHNCVSGPLGKTYSLS